MRNLLIAISCLIALCSCGDFMTGMANGLYGGMGGYGMPYWSADSSYPVTSSTITPASSGSNTGSSTTSTSRRVCVTCHGGGKCNSCGGTGKRTDNYYGTGRSSTATCGVCNGRGSCTVCGGSGYR